MRAADFLLFPSRMEGCPYVVLEAMACGLPVIGCRDTPLDEIVPEGGGILRAPEDVDGFVDAIRGVTPDAHASARRIVRARAEVQLSEAVWLDHTEAILLKAISAG